VNEGGLLVEAIIDTEFTTFKCNAELKYVLVTSCRRTSETPCVRKSP
jgi:hypothetical protein